MGTDKLQHGIDERQTELHEVADTLCGLCAAAAALVSYLKDPHRGARRHRGY